jgi:acyl-CoA synthetase (AMP-forming)/AMP-acid ligase II
LREEDPTLFRQRVRAFCRERLERYKVPAVIEMVDDDHHGERFKKSRKAVTEG